MLTGKVPFDAETRGSAPETYLHPLPPPHYWSGLHPELEKVLLKALV
jgi:hypothetical protein